MPTPISDDDWKIHALNVHGGFFEQKVASIIKEFSPEELSFVTSEYPVRVAQEESRLDILGFISFFSDPRSRSGIYLAIECKKHNAEFIDWIFYPTIQNQLYGESHSKCTFLKAFSSTTQTGIKTKIALSHKQNSDKPISGDCREVRGTYKDVANGIKTKTSNSSINEASYQVTLATHSLINKQVQLNNENIKQTTNSLFEVYAYLPIIITTANLYILDYEVNDIDTSTGEISLDKAKLNPVNWLWYEYPIPPHLQLDMEIDFNNKITTQNNFRKFDYDVRRNIMVINSGKIEETLDWLIRHQDNVIDY